MQVVKCGKCGAPCSTCCARCLVVPLCNAACRRLHAAEDQHACRRALARRVLDSLQHPCRIDVDFRRLASESHTRVQNEMYHSYATSCATLADSSPLPLGGAEAGARAVQIVNAQERIQDAARAGLPDAQYAYFYFAVLLPLAEARAPSAELIRRIDANVEAATDSLVRAAKAGHPLAQFSLSQLRIPQSMSVGGAWGRLLSTERDHFLRAAAETGLVAAQYAYGARLIKYAQDDEGRRFLHAAARQGDALAHRMLLDFA